MDSVGIEVFLQIVRNRSISRAAEAVHLAQSTVSKRLQMLEDYLGYSLIERGKGIKTLELTPQGIEFIKIAERWQDLIHDAYQVGRLKVHYNIAIGTVPSANMTFVPQLCRRLLSHEPCIHFKIISLHSLEMYEEVEKRNIDVGFSLVEQVNQNVAAIPCFSVPMIGIRLQQGALDKNLTVDIRTLNPANCIFINWGTRYQMWHDYWFHSGDMPKASIDNPYLLFTIIERKEQWAIVPLAIANLLLALNKFETFYLDPAPPDRIFFKLTHKSPKPNAYMALEVFDDYLRKELLEGYTDVYTVF